MEAIKLISMTDFVIQQRSELMFKELGKACCKYADFLKKPLQLGFFVPCDENGNVLNEPKDWKVYESGGSAFMNMDEISPCQEYKKAKERVLLKVECKIGICNEKPAIWINDRGAQIINDFKFLTIEDLVHWNFELTDSAIKQIGH